MSAYAMYVVTRHTETREHTSVVLYGPCATYDLAKTLCDELTTPNSWCTISLLNMPRKVFMVPELYSFAEDTN